MTSYNKLYTPEDNAGEFIDRHLQMTLGVANTDHATLIKQELGSPLESAARGRWWISRRGQSTGNSNHL